MPRAPLRRQCAPSKARVQWVRSITRLEVPRKPPPSTKMATKRAQEIYAQRSRVAEFPHAWIKQHCGLRQFRCRGRLKACVEAMWAASNRLTRCRPRAMSGCFRRLHFFGLYEGAGRSQLALTRYGAIWFRASAYDFSFAPDSLHGSTG